MDQRPLGRTGLNIAPLVFGGNVFGWTADEATSHRLLDRYLDGGFNAVDTAESYSHWVPGHQGGESEAIIGSWLRAVPSRRDRVVIITKVGPRLGSEYKGLSAQRILAAADASLRRLATDHIDLYLTHFPDPLTPIEETLGAYETLIRQGKVRAIGCSNYDVPQLREALRVSAGQGLPRYEVLQPEYNLYDRSGFESGLRGLCIDEGLGAITYYALASGFLSGKYRSQADLAGHARGAKAGTYLNERGLRILAALDAVAAAHGATPAQVAIAWLVGARGVTAPIASATSVEQLDSLMQAVQLELTAEDRAALDAASVPLEPSAPAS